MFGLELGLSILLVVCILAVCAFEFINGFHDTANAVATVIYTNSLKPVQAVVLSGILNGIGVLVGGIAVAIGIINLLPVETLVDQDIGHSIGMVLAILLTAIAWNFGTWYMGIPASSSHTLIGSILGVGIAYSLLPGTGEAAVNWSKAEHIGLSLLCSPLVGGGLALILMYILRKTLKGRDDLFGKPAENKPPPTWVRAILILTCSSVSFSHGSNDGQKGVGLMMLILIGIVPAKFALDSARDTSEMQKPFEVVASAWNQADAGQLKGDMLLQFNRVDSAIQELKAVSVTTYGFGEIPDDKRFVVRKDILVMNKMIGDLLDDAPGMLGEKETKELKGGLKELASFTEYAPLWVIALIALSLGIGTMVGWKRIVVTIGEKIGKTHLSYAQGASAEIVAASTIGFSTGLGLPVSTTQVLSSGIAGTMVASNGLKNLQKNTIRNIALAWVLTFPVCVTLSGSLFLLFRAVIG